MIINGCEAMTASSNGNFQIGPLASVTASVTWGVRRHPCHRVGVARKWNRLHGPLGTVLARECAIAVSYY